MSSIDKYVEEHAQGLDRRVRVTNRNGHIVGKIDGRVVFDVADRYGYLNDSERRQIERGVNAYLAEEAEERRRRREEEERRRREEEERRRREEEERRRRLEAERQAAIASGRTVIQNKIREVENFFNGISAPAKSNVQPNREILELFDVSEFLNSAQDEINQINRDATRDIQNKKQSVLNLLNSNLNSLPNVPNAEEARNVANRSSNVKYSFDPSGYNDRSNKLNKQLNETIQACNRVYEQVMAFDRKYNNSTSKSLIQRVKNIKIRNTKDLKQVLNMIESAVGALESEEEKRVMQESIKALSKANEGLMQLNLQADVNLGEKYEIPTFDVEINEVKQNLTAIREELLSAEYSTCSAEIMMEVENYLSELQLGEQAYSKGKEIADRLKTVKLQDQRLRPAYDAFIRAKDDALKFGVDVPFDFDPDDPEGQIDAIAEKVAIKQIEDANEEMWNRGQATHALMDGLRYDLIGMKEEEGMLVYIYAREDLEGVVMQVNVTEEGIRRKLIGIKMNGQESSVETIKEAARILEEQGEPELFMGGYRTAFPEAFVAGDVGWSDSEGIEQVLEENGVYDLDEEGKVEAYRQIVKEKPQATFSSVPRYVPPKSHSINVTIAKDRDMNKKKYAQKNVKRYQTKE